MPPNTAEGIRSVIRNSLDLSRPLCEASPGTQIARREQHELERAMENTTPGSGLGKPPLTKPLALPTKFMRADSAKSGSGMSNSLSNIDSVRPVSAVFAKFAIPMESTSVGSEPAVGPLATKSGNTVMANQEVKKLKSPVAMRSRVNSTTRRVSWDLCWQFENDADTNDIHRLHLQQKLGWARRKEVGPASPLRAKRTVARLSYKSLRDSSNKENTAQIQ